MAETNLSDEVQPSRSRPGTKRGALHAMPHAARRMVAQVFPFARTAAPLPGTPLYLPDSQPLTHGSEASLGAIGSLEVRLAASRRDIHRAQHLRYRVFYEEMSAKPTLVHKLLRRDFDPYDGICDHLLVFDHDAPPNPKTGEPAIVGTYRLLRQDVAQANGGFYTAGEYQIDKLVAVRPDLRFLELGRSCVLKPYRTKRTVELLWHGIWSYVVQRRIDVLFGCASLDGTDPNELAEPLSYLHHFAGAKDEWAVRAVEHRFEPMDRMAKGAISQKQALRLLPPLIKGYVRVGGMIGDGAVVDHQFGTTDVLIILPVENISKRYISYYGEDASRRAN